MRSFYCVYLLYISYFRSLLKDNRMLIIFLILSASINSTIFIIITLFLTIVITTTHIILIVFLLSFTLLLLSLLSISLSLSSLLHVYHCDYQKPHNHIIDIIISATALYNTTIVTFIIIELS